MCCDNCTAARHSQSPAISEPQLDRSNELVITVKMESNAADIPAGHCVQQHLQDAQDMLLSWRRSTALYDFPHACFTLAILLPDPILSALTSKHSLTTINSLQTSLPCPWVFAEKYGEEILAVVKKLDKDYDMKRMADKETQCIESEHHAAKKVLSAQRVHKSHQLQQAKENCNILGTNW